MPYGTIKVDNITFTNGGSDSTITVSGIVEAISGNITATGTIQGATIIGTSTVSGATVTGNTGQFTTLTGGAAGFTTVTGVSGIFTSQISGATVTGSTASFTSGTFVSGIFTTQISGATITGNTGNFTTFNAGTANLTSGVFASGTQGAPSLSIGTTTNGLYSPGEDQVAISTNGQGRLYIAADGKVGIGQSVPVDSLHVVGAARFGTTNFIGIGADGSGSYLESAVGTHVLRFNTNGDERLRITSTGTVNIVGAGSAGSTQAVSFNGSAPVNSLVLTSGGLLGVGTSSPGGILDIRESNSGGTALAQLVNTSNTASSNARFKIATGGTSAGNPILQFTNDTSNWYINADQSDSFKLKIGTTVSDSKFVVDSSGNVGIGTSSPNKPLQIYSGSSDSEIRLQSNSGTEQNAYITLRNSGGKLDLYSVNGDIALNPGNNVAATFKADGKVGIGTSSPEDRLDLGSGYLRFKEAIGGTGTYGAIRAFNTLVNTTPATSIRFIRDVANVGNDGAICFDTVNSERARIDSSGTFTVKGVGTAAFSVNGGAPNNSLIVDSSGRCLVGTSSTSATSTAVFASRSDGAAAPLLALHTTESTVTDGANFATLSFGNTATTGTNAAAFIQGQRDGGTWTNNSSMPGRLVFSTTPDNQTPFTGPVERMRIQQNGFTKVSSTGSYYSEPGTYHEIRSATNDNFALIVTHAGTSGNQYGINIITANDQNDATRTFLRCDGLGTTRFNLLSNGGLANYSANNANLSDRNAKKDISPAADTWDCIKQWEIVNYRYKDQPDDADLNLGVIAQQVAESCPEVITIFEEAKDDQPEKLGIKEQQMYWMAIKALQEAQARIETLEAKVAALESA